MASTKLFGIRVQNSNKQNPFVTGSQQPTIQGIINFFRGLTSQKAQRTVIQTTKNQVAATATLVSNGLTTSDVAGASINGLNATATYASSPNNTLTLIKNKINGGGDTPNVLISSAVSATRYFTDATGFFTLNGATGSVSPKVGGSTADYTCTFTATGDNAVDAAALANVINAKAGSGLQVFAYSDGVNKCYVKSADTNRATITLSSASGVVGCRINGIETTVTWATSDAATATALTVAINANTALANVARAVNSASGVVTIISMVEGDQMPAIGAVGIDPSTKAAVSGLLVGGTTTPSTTITVTIAANKTMVALVNGLEATSVNSVGTNATDAAALAAAINSSPVARGLVTAKVSSNVVTVTSLAGTTLQAIGTGAAASSATLTDSGTYGGVAGNAITLNSATGVNRSAATLSGGVSGLLVTSNEAGAAGNWITFAAAGAAAAHVTASGARLSGGLETVQNFVYA
jgi:hypothetical protein